MGKCNKYKSKCHLRLAAKMEIHFRDTTMNGKVNLHLSDL